MDCRHFLLLQQEVGLDPGNVTIAYCLGKVLEESPPNVRKAGLALTLRENNLRPNADTFKVILDHLPQDDFKMERYLIFRCVPLPLILHPNLCKIVVDHVTDILLETRLERLQLARDNLGELLIQIPELVLRHDETSLLTTFSDKDKIAVLYYIEEFVKPVFDTDCLRMSNRMYSVLAKNLPSQSFNQFFKCVMESDNFSYHNLMAAFTHRAKTNQMPIGCTLEYLKTKKTENTTRAIFGNITQSVIQRIEYNFVHKLLKNTTREEMDLLLNKIRLNLLITPEALEKVLLRQYNHLKRRYTDELSVSERLHNLSSRCVLTRQGKIMKKRHEILNQALVLEEQYYEMNPDEKKIFFAVLASQSFPKIRCKDVGSNSLFKILGRRLLELVPPTGASFCVIELNEYSNVLYCMYNLYRINHRYKRLLREILPEWRSRLVTLIDLQMMSSANLHHAVPLEQDENKKLMLKRINHIIVLAGTLLAYLFGNIEERQLFIVPHYWSYEVIFQEFKLTDSFSPFLAPLGLYQTCPGPRVRLLGNNEFERIERLGAINDELLDTDEEDEDEEDEDEEEDEEEEEEEGEEEEDEEEEEEEEDSGSEDEESEDDEDSSSDDGSFFEGELDDELHEEDDSGEEGADDADDEVSANEAGSNDPALSGTSSCIIAQAQDVSVIEENSVARGSDSNLRQYLDSLFADPNLDVQTPDLPFELLGNTSTAGGSHVQSPLEAIVNDAEIPAWTPVGVNDEVNDENPEPNSQQWHYGISKIFTAEEMAKHADTPIELDPNMPIEGAADPNEWGNLDNPDERRFYFGSMADAYRI